MIDYYLMTIYIYCHWSTMTFSAMSAVFLSTKNHHVIIKGTCKQKWTWFHLLRMFFLSCLFEKNPNHKNYTFIIICYVFINHYAIPQLCHEFVTLVALIAF